MLGLNIAGKGFISKFGYLKRLVQQIAHSRHVGHGPTWAYLQSNIIKATWPKKRVNLPWADACWDVSNVAVNARITCDIFYQEKKLHQFQATRICPTTWCPILCCWWSFSSLFTLFHIFMHILAISHSIFPWKPPFSTAKKLWRTCPVPGGGRPPLTSVRDRPS